jgi:hypothetical protein
MSLLLSLEKQQDNNDNKKGEEVKHCPICNEDKKVIKVERLPDRKQFTLECGHPYGEISTVINENVPIGENVEFVILKDPLAEVRRAVNEQDYFKTVTYACSVLEYCGQQILLWNSIKNNTTNPLTVEEVKEWKLFRVINELLKYRLITSTEATKLHEIRDLRTDFVHEDYAIKITSATAGKVNALNNDIIHYVGYIKEMYDNMAKNTTTTT